MGMILVAVILDLACWVNIKAANFIFLFEALQLVLEGFLPIDHG